MMNSGHSVAPWYERLTTAIAEDSCRIMKCNTSKGCKPFLNKILNSVVNDVIFGKEKYMGYIPGIADSHGVIFHIFM
jgi:hypothetical protein